MFYTRRKIIKTSTIQRKIDRFLKKQKDKLDQLKEDEKDFYQSLIEKYIPDAKINGFKIRCSISTKENKDGTGRYPRFFASKYSPIKKRGINVSLGGKFNVASFEKKIDAYLAENKDLFKVA